MNNYYFKFMINDYYIFVIIILVLVAIALAICSITFSYENKHRKIITKRKIMEIDNAELIRNMKEADHGK